MDLVVDEAREKRNGIAKAGLEFTDRGGVQTDLSQKFSEFVAFFYKRFGFREL